MVISVFQALTLLAQKYHNDPTNQEKYAKIKHLYLSGVRNDADKEILDELLQDKLLDGYQISGSKQDINEDPVRRYFESQLSHSTMDSSLDQLDSSLLEENFEKIFSKMPASFQVLVPATIYRNLLIDLVSLKSATAREYSEGIRILKDPNSYQSLLPTEGTAKEKEEVLQQRKEKMILLTKSSHAAMTAVQQASDSNEFPLDLYSVPNYVYDSKNRGRVPKGTDQTVRSQNLGIMKAYMPLPRDDALYSEEQAQYVRPPDGSRYVEGAQQPEAAFANLVTPFSASISGTMLCLLRVIGALYKDGEFVYAHDEAQLKLFFKTFISSLMYQVGGHSFDEFMRVLQLPEVQEEFKNLPGFTSLTLETLFKNENEAAFEAALAKTFEYNNVILNQKRVHEELTNKANKIEVAEDDTIPNEMVEAQAEEDLQTTQVRSGLKDMKSSLGKPTSLDRLNKIIDAAYNVYSSPDSSDLEKEKAAKTLIEKLRIKDIDGTNKPEIESKIKIEMAKREQKTRESLFFSGNGTLATRLDKAWAIYTDTNRTNADRAIARSFLVYAFDIKGSEENLDQLLNQLMEEREAVRASNPEFIPRKSPIIPGIDPISYASLKRTEISDQSGNETINDAILNEDLVDVAPFSKRKDRGEITGRKTEFFNAEMRDMFRVLIRDGEFVREGLAIDTSDCISHDKEGFAAFTLNANGELSLFNHIDHDRTGIAHSSMNAGVPVVAAGEVQIINGRLISITDHSGHYRPTAYTLYKTLDYFQKNGVDISNVKVYTFKDPGQILDIESKRSEEHSRFFVCNAVDLCNSFAGHLRKELNSMINNLVEYQSFFNLESASYYVKDAFTDSSLTADRAKIAKDLTDSLVALLDEINTLNSIESVSIFVEKLEKLQAKAADLNNALVSDGSQSSGRLAAHIENFGNQLQKIKSEIESKKDNLTPNQNIMAHNPEDLKNISRDIPNNTPRSLKELSTECQLYMKHLESVIENALRESHPKLSSVKINFNDGPPSSPSIEDIEKFVLQIKANIDTYAEISTGISTIEWAIGQYKAVKDIDDAAQAALMNNDVDTFSRCREVNEKISQHSETISNPVDTAAERFLKAVLYYLSFGQIDMTDKKTEDFSQKLNSFSIFTTPRNNDKTPGNKIENEGIDKPPIPGANR